MKILSVLCLLALCSSKLLAQSDSVKIIAREVVAIDKDATLVKKEFEAEEAFGRAYDGGGFVRIYVDSNKEIKKIEEQIGLSWGRISKVIYFNNATPIKIIDTEANFRVSPNQTIDHTKLDAVFEAIIYVLDWNEDRTKTSTVGKRNMSEGSCALVEYEAVIDRAKTLLSGKR